MCTASVKQAAVKHGRTFRKGGETCAWQSEALWQAYRRLTLACRVRQRSLCWGCCHTRD